ncbi:MAG: hypothetical protein R3246_16835, partial [Acidimicrobiia bacterium]|nr:hypothetical protein [Acidimicrobiia bacterium]
MAGDNAQSSTTADLTSDRPPVAVDAMGGDHAPDVVVAGARLAAERDGIPILLVGDPDRLGDVGDLKVVAAKEVVAMDADPAVSVRKLKDSSIV